MDTLAHAVVVVFLLFQLLYPLRYYATSHDKTDDFGAWRMFSTKLWNKDSRKYFAVSSDVVRVDLQKDLGLSRREAGYFSKKPANWVCVFLLEEMCRRLPTKPSRVFYIRETFWYWSKEKVSHEMAEHNCSQG